MVAYDRERPQTTESRAVVCQAQSIMTVNCGKLHDDDDDDDDFSFLSLQTSNYSGEE